jgi:uncharacterized protein
MQFEKFGNKYIVRLDKGEEIVETLKQFCEKEKIYLASVSGIGATNKVVVGLFDAETKKYHSTELTGNFEISPLSGNVSTMNNEVYMHLHINICDKENKSFGGHLNSAIVSATFEAIIDVIDGKIDRAFNPDVGLNTIEFL